MLKEPHEPHRPFRRGDAGRLLGGVVLFLGLLAVGVVPDLSPANPGFAPGVMAASNVRAPRAAVVANPVETELARQAAAAAVPPQYDFTVQRASTIANQQMAALTTSLVLVDAAFGSDKTPEARRAALASVLPGLPDADRATLLNLDPGRWKPIEQAALALLGQVERTEIKDRSVADQLVAEDMPAGFSASEQSLIAAMVTPLVVANSNYSMALTQQAREAAAATVSPISDTVEAGQILVAAGEKITASDMVLLSYFGLDQASVGWNRIGAWILLSAMAAALLLVWVWRFRPEYWQRARTIVLIGLVFAIGGLAEKLLGEHTLLPYLIPTAAAAMTLTVLLDAGTGTIVLALLAILAGAANQASLEVAAYVYLAGMAGTLAIRKGERQYFFVQGAFAVAITGVGVVALFTLLGLHDTTALAQLSIAAVLSAALSIVLTIGSFALLGNLFGILTGSQLLELANPSQPLLRRLLVETPGTYHHSLMVGNLAERAAEAIGGDPLLVRVAAYYHDVGKLANPLVFIENQQGENVHDQLDPKDSAAILKQHVPDGVELAYRARLPKPLIAFIPQHHGTSLVSYFYAKAREEAAAPFGGLDKPAGRAAADAVEVLPFRHDGPKPQSREAAVLMLADGVEASVRSLSSRDEATIRAMVTQIIAERLADGQLNECELTIRDLEHVREAFVGQLLGMYHQRIAYPQNKIVELESRRERGHG